MVAGWFIGDGAKTVYYIVMKLPFQFQVGGCLTVLIDLQVLVQYFYYGYCVVLKEQDQEKMAQTIEYVSYFLLQIYNFFYSAEIGEEMRMPTPNRMKTKSL